VEVLDRITHDKAGGVEYHYVLVDYVCWPVGGILAAGSDVEDAVFAAVHDLGAYQLTDAARRVIAAALRMKTLQDRERTLSNRELRTAKPEA
jgi:hypothetical protein